MRTIRAAMFIVPFLAACVSTPGAQPHDMSAREHEAMGFAEQKNAAAHQARYQEPPGRKGKVCGVLDVCWSDIVNPTDEHRKEAERHRKAAADHLAASQALRDAEARACAGLSEQDRAMSPFAHTQDILQVDEYPFLSTAIVTFRAVPGMTAERLQHTVDCHLARNGVLGHKVPEMSYCPLALAGVTATANATKDGFEVRITADEPAIFREVLKRARALRPH